MWISRHLFLLSAIGLCVCPIGKCLGVDTAVPPQLPPECSFNKDAGHGNSLFVKLRVNGGDEALFMLDTGCLTTILDKSFESKLGKPLGAKKISYGWLGARTVGIYRAPRLSLGGVDLIAGDRVFTDDTSITSKPRGAALAGIVGLDCLRHYCVQLDFADGRIRFLSPDSLDAQNLGKAFPLTVWHGGLYFDGDFFGVKDARTRIDTADYDDGALSRKIFEREVQNQEGVTVREWKDANGVTNSQAFFPTGLFAGETCANLVLNECPPVAQLKMNIVGLRLLARHLVTFNFPGQTLYLLPRSLGSPGDWIDLTMEAYGFLWITKVSGALPGWSKDDHGRLDVESTAADNQGTDPASRTFDAVKTGDTARYHYTVIKPSKAASWKLQKAWRTDATGHVIEEFPIQ